MLTRRELKAVLPLGVWMYQIIILDDRYEGAYAGGKWIAIMQAFDKVGKEESNLDRIQNGPLSGDVSASNFWGEVEEYPELFDWLAVGNTPQKALSALEDKQRV